MRLAELDPCFVRYEMRVDTFTRVLGDPLTWKDGDPTEQVTEPREITILDVLFAEAQGLWMLCPKCFAANGGRRGTHGINVSFEGRGVPPNMGSEGDSGQATRWGVRGSTLEDLQLSPSILIVGGCGWHGYVGLSVPGEVTSC